jgi:magnesium transporter
MISLYCWSRGQKAGLWVSAELLKTHTEQLRSTPDVYWIDLADPTPEEEALVFEQVFPIHRLSREDITRMRREAGAAPHFPKAEEFPEYLFVIVNPLSQRLIDRVAQQRTADASERKRLVTQLSVILTRQFIITHHYERVASVEGLRTFLSKHEEQSERGPDYLFHLILDAMVDEFAPVLDHIHAALDRLESRVFAKPTQEQLRRLMSLKRRIIALRKTLIYEREIVARLARGEFSLIDEREMVYYRNVYDHVVRFTELIESARETANDLVQTHLSATSNKLNEIMKVLTMISTTILPMTLISGIYGMNFAHLPEKDWELGYPFALGLMLLTGIASFIYFRWRKWI